MRCQQMGIGITLNPMTITTAEVYSAVTTILRKSLYKQNMRVLQRQALTLPRLCVSQLMTTIESRRHAGPE